MFLSQPFLSQADEPRWVSTARSVLRNLNIMTVMIMMMPAAFAHDTAPHFFFSTFIFCITAFMTGGDFHRNMPAHIAARYDAGAWAAGIVSYLLFRITSATIPFAFLVFMAWSLLTYWGYTRLDAVYGADAEFARKHPEIAARRAEEKRRADEEYKKTQEYKDWENFKFTLLFMAFTFIFFCLYIIGSARRDTK